MSTKAIYQKPEIELVEMEMAGAVMVASNVNVSSDSYDGEANAQRRNFWSE